MVNGGNVAGAVAYKLITLVSCETHADECIYVGRQVHERSHIADPAIMCNCVGTFNCQPCGIVIECALQPGVGRKQVNERVSHELWEYRKSW